MAQEEDKLLEVNWKWTSIIPIAVLGIVEAAVWSLIEDFPKWAKVSTIVLGLLFIGAYNVAVKWRAFVFVRWALGLAFVLVTACPFVFTHKRIVETPRPAPNDKQPSETTVSLQLKEWGTYPPGIAYGVLDATKLFPYRDQFKVMLAIRAPDHTVEPLDDHNIMKSNLFDVPEHNLRIDISMSQPFLEHMRALDPNVARIDFWLCVLPTNVSPDKIFTMRNVTSEHGVCQFQGQAFGGRPGTNWFSIEKKQKRQS